MPKDSWTMRTEQQSKQDRIDLCSFVHSRMLKLLVVNTPVPCGEQGRAATDTVAKRAMRTQAVGTHDWRWIASK